MASIYSEICYRLITRNRLTIEDVPEDLREEVQAMLDKDKEVISNE